MVDEREKKPTKKPAIGSISQFATLGSRKKKFEEVDSQIADKEAAQQSSDQDNQNISAIDSQIASNLDSQIIEYPESQKAQLPDNQTTGKQDKKMVSYLREKKPERKQQIAYLPPALIKRLKRYAVDNEREISEVVADALTEFLEKREDENK